ncbi:MAG: NFACT RNA binding domain-containing protein [Reichenbachiella sp.]|uniref:NFACT RNA binding domain-containing protein n=1 Tax=Reichenbachiella sp. TaxID=2184521 RepID=UPI003265738E
MQFNYYFLKFLSIELAQAIAGKSISSIFSQNKNELVLVFDESQLFVIKANLSGHHSLLSFPQEFSRARKNSVDLFSEIIGLKVTGVRQYENERAFSINLENGYDILFKLQGRHSNIILYHQNSVHSLFKNGLEKDLEIQLDQLDRVIDQSENAIIDNSFELAQVYPTFDKNIKDHLKSCGYFETNLPNEKLAILRKLVDELNQSEFFITERDGIPKMLLFKPTVFTNTFDRAIEASNFLAKNYYSAIGIAQLKQKMGSEVRKEIKKSKSYLYQNKAKLEEIENRRGYDELANILMANLHVSIDPGIKSIDLFDFYQNETITIKLKSNLSLLKNAELMYRKSKNQAKEVKVLSENIKAKEKKLAALLKRLETIESTEDLKSLKVLDKGSVSQKQETLSSPFMEFMIDGFHVYVGKNAKNNDLLTQKYAKKDDIWMHARDVSGSHVVIKRPNGINIPIHTLEKVAQLAAWYSKRKSDTLCPVIYTPKKFVRKPKGSLPGQVVLAQEKVLLVKPEKVSF